MTPAAHDTTELQDRLQALEDRIALVDLIGRQGLWLDEQQWAQAHLIFTADAAVRTPGGTAQGLEALVEQARRNHTRFARTQHLTTNILVELDGDHATIRANLLVSFVQDAATGAVHSQLGERYRFEALRTPAGWRLSRVEVAPVWSTGARLQPATPAQ